MHRFIVLCCVILDPSVMVRPAREGRSGWKREIRLMDDHARRSEGLRERCETEGEGQRQRLSLLYQARRYFDGNMPVLTVCFRLYQRCQLMVTEAASTSVDRLTPPLPTRPPPPLTPRHLKCAKAQ